MARCGIILMSMARSAPETVNIPTIRLAPGCGVFCFTEAKMTRKRYPRKFTRRYRAAARRLLALMARVEALRRELFHV
jgi:hypothetical protein